MGCRPNPAIQAKENVAVSIITECCCSFLQFSETPEYLLCKLIMHTVACSSYYQFTQQIKLLICNILCTQMGAKLGSSFPKKYIFPT